MEALHKYTCTGSDQQMQVSMALLPSVAKKIDFAKVDKENILQQCMEKQKDAFCGSDDDDFVPMRKKKFDSKENIKAMFPSLLLPTVPLTSTLESRIHLNRTVHGF